MSTQQERLDRVSALFKLINMLPGEDFGAGRPACSGVDPELFDPVSEADTGRITAAREICAACPVQASCLQFALRTGEDHGIWGGLTAAERREVRVLRRRDGQAGSGEVAA